MKKRILSKDSVSLKNYFSKEALQYATDEEKQKYKYFNIIYKCTYIVNIGISGTEYFDTKKEAKRFIKTHGLSSENIRFEDYFILIMDNQLCGRVDGLIKTISPSWYGVA